MPADLHPAGIGPDPVRVMDDRRGQPQHLALDLAQRVNRFGLRRGRGLDVGHGCMTARPRRGHNSRVSRRGAVTIPERSVHTVAFVGETRWSRTAAVAGVVMLAQWVWISGVDLASADREPVAAFLAVVGEPGPEQDWPGAQDAALDQGQGRAVLTGQAEPLGEHGPVCRGPGTPVA